MICNKCNGNFPDDNKFCANCGAEREEILTQVVTKVESTPMPKKKKKYAYHGD